MDRSYVIALLVVGMLALSFGCLGMGGVTPGSSSGSGSHEWSGAAAGFEGGSAQAPSAYGDSDSYNGVVPQQYLDSSGRMVVKSGYATILVPQGTLEERYARLKSLINQTGGVVYGSEYGESSNEKYYYITIKVPPAAFESLPQALGTIGELKSLNTETDDVTESYVDLAVRIRNLEAEKVRLITFYNNTQNVSELLQVEREVTRVQTEIERLTAQKLQLERQAELATMRVRIYEETPMVDRTVMVPLNSLVSIFLGAFSFAITIIAAISGFGIPFIVILGLLVLLIIGVKKVTSRGKKK